MLHQSSFLKSIGRTVSRLVFFIFSDEVPFEGTVLLDKFIPVTRLTAECNWLAKEPCEIVDC